MVTGITTSGVLSVVIRNGGFGYTNQGSPPLVTFAAPTGSNPVLATGTAVVNGAGVITGINITNPGSGYTTAPTITIVAPVATANGTGQSATAVAIIGNAGSGYSPSAPPAVTLGPPIGFGMSVAVEDAFGNLVNSTAPITLATGISPGNAINSGTATLGGTLTAAASGGVATFTNLNLDHRGRGATLNASSPGLATTTTSPFNVLVGVVTQLVVTSQPPSSVIDAGGTTPESTFNTYVTAEDSSGDTVPSYAGPTSAETISVGTPAAATPTISGGSLAGFALFLDRGQ